MIYQFRVTLPGIKGFYRIYKVNSANTFYSFHKQLQADLEFPTDQPILFKAMSGEEVLARYALVNLGFGMVDEIPVEKAVKAGADHFEYFYDTKAKKKVIITLEGEETGNEVTVPTLMNDMKGPLPIEFENGYVAFEDLPQEKRKLPGEKSALEMLLGGDDDEDDEDLEDEEDEEDDEDEEEDDETEEIYDENE
ncbi:MAG: hypothetical protein IJM05_04770 [Bacteroidales bacterium]|nr:hypothetical protein [Bacteroidales bacterium]MBR3500101.1 hypothetical protein [Bacteroidales bacterium]